MGGMSGTKVLIPILTAVVRIVHTPPQQQHLVNNLRQYRHEI